MSVSNLPQKRAKKPTGQSVRAENLKGQARTLEIEKRLSEIPKLSRTTMLRAFRGEAGSKGAIKAFCLECSGWKREHVATCMARTCPLWLYRPKYVWEERVS